MTKVVRDGLVAVLYSPEYGAGWSTWAEKHEEHLLLFEPDVVQLVLERDSGDITPDEFQTQVEHIWQLKQYESYCSPEKLCVAWIKEGAQFKIEEYDGNETVILAQDVKWHTA